MTVQEIEFACKASQTLDFSRHEQETPELLLRKVFYPRGFPVEVRTNSAEILSLYKEVWGIYRKKFDTEKILVDVLLVESDATECPPTPVFRMTQPKLVFVADANNYSLIDLSVSKTQITVSRAALRRPKYLQYFFLDAAASSHIATRYMTPVHAACVALNKCAVLLCGDSGAGKSSLSYACARAGWTFVADDSSYLLNEGTGRMVMGDCHRVRLRPTAAELFPEINGLKMTPRAAGKPSIEIATATMPHIDCAPTAKVDFIVFLNRHSGRTPDLVPYRKDVARYFMRQVLYGSAKSLARQYEVIERVLTADVLELRYTDMDWAIDRLQTLLRERR
jgi:hypothetical protein